MDAADLHQSVRQLGARARSAARSLGRSPSAQRHAALVAIAEAVEREARSIAAANAEDLAAGRERGLEAALLDRLALTPARIQAMADGVRAVAEQGDPIGEITALSEQTSGLRVGQMRVPLGVIGIIYESRPNVTVDAAALCLKGGNACILRGGSEAIRSNRVIAAAIQSALATTALPPAAVQLVETTDRAAVSALLAMDDYLDVIIPRGGKGLTARVSAEARVPVLYHLDGICHTYVDDRADLAMAEAVVFNAKTYRYGICGALETLLVHVQVAGEFLPRIGARFRDHEVAMHACPRALPLLGEGAQAAVAEDWDTEYLGPVIAIKVVDDLTAAIDHIEAHGSHHTDAIITADLARADRFTREVDSASVMVNAATCFADGAMYGRGAEIGIATGKLHARGPVGARELTTQKFVVYGDGAVRS